MLLLGFLCDDNGCWLLFLSRRRRCPIAELVLLMLVEWRSDLVWVRLLVVMQHGAMHGILDTNCPSGCGGRSPLKLMLMKSGNLLMRRLVTTCRLLATVDSEYLL